MVNLHTHSQYSRLDGLSTIEGLIARATEYGQDALAITDHGDMGGILPLLAKASDIKPIVGYEAYMVPDISVREKGEKRFHITLIARDIVGYKNLIKLSSEAYLNGVYYRPRVDYKMLREYGDGLYALSGCMGGILGQTILGEVPGNLDAELRNLLDIFGENLFIELIPYTDPRQIEINHKLTQLAIDYGLPLVATSDSHYVKKEDHELHEILLSIQTQKKLDDPARTLTFPSPDLYLFSDGDMRKGLSYLPKECVDEAIENTDIIAYNCERMSLPQLSVVHYTVPDDKEFVEWMLDNRDRTVNMPSDEAYMRYLLMRASQKIPYDHPKYNEYAERLNHEFNVIKERDFISYFLVVRDYIQWARGRGIMVGPARGSAAGSLVANMLDITEVDPLKYDLLFERFISPGRKVLPDIDTDFEHDRREEVIDYIIQKYGSAAPIAAYQRLQKKQVLKDVAKTLGVTLAKSEKLSGNIMKPLAGLEEVASFRELFEDPEFDKEIREIVSKDLGTRTDSFINAVIGLEGTIKSFGKHPAGLIISPTELTDIIPLRVVTGNTTIQADMYDLEEIGGLKVDVLGVKTLTVIAETLRLAQQEAETAGADWHPSDIDWTLAELDKATWDNISLGETIGLFQLETHGMRNMCRSLRPNNIDELSAVVALNRPGPLGSGLADAFIRRANGQETTSYLFPEMESILEETYGVMLYQEQVIRLVQELADYTPEDADRLRKIIGKKKKDQMVAEEENFKRQMLTLHGTSEEVLKRIDILWEQIATHGGYSFNKCITGDTLVTRRSCNHHESLEITIEEMYQRKFEKSPVGKKYRRKGFPDILSIYPDGRIRPQKIKDIYYNGKKPVYEIILENGMKVKATKDHRFLTSLGWKRLEELSVGIGMITEQEDVRELKGWKTERAKGKTYDNRGFPEGTDNPAYIDGRTISFNTVKKEKEKISSCELCGGELGGRPEFHHADGDRLNNSYDNVKKVCNSCHKKADYELGKRKKRWTKGRASGPSEIVSIKYVGYEHTYDIEMETFPNFMANGIITHNSHSVSYAVLAYRTAYLKTHYSQEYMTSLLNVEQDKQSLYLEECRRMGISLLAPDINDSKKGFVLTEAGIRFGLNGINNLGEVTTKLIIDHQPYESPRDFVDRTPTKINKKVVESLIAAGAFDIHYPGVSRADILRAYYNHTGSKAEVPEIFYDPVGCEAKYLGALIDDPKKKWYDIMWKNCDIKSEDQIYSMGNAPVKISGTLHGVTKADTRRGTTYLFDFSPMWGIWVKCSSFTDPSKYEGKAIVLDGKFGKGYNSFLVEKIYDVEEEMKNG